LPGGVSSMDLLVNDLSLHGQFHDVAAFRDAISNIMRIRQIARRHMRSLYCHRGLANAQATPRESIQAAVRTLLRNEQSALLTWLNQHGPFWDDNRKHNRDDWYECGGEIVTDTAIGEAAHCLLHGIDRGLVSFQPSSFLHDPVPVESVISGINRTSVDIRNFWDPVTVEQCLVSTPPALTSWANLGNCCVTRFEHLRFAQDAFEPLRGQPFKQSAAERILARLDVLHRLRKSFAQDGSLSSEGHEIYRKYFTGDKAWFSDSSDGEKNDFEKDLTFNHPDAPGQTLFCTWHGKVKSPQYRIHISWPVTVASPVYVVYVGPKITKR
jgi:hypothetical protein